MPFNAQAWINDIVRTSHYILPDQPVDYGDINATPDELVAALITITSSHVDNAASAALMPARIPEGSLIPEALHTHFEDIVQALASYGTDLHPAVRHALLAVALEAPERESKIDALNVLLTGLDNGMVYQPTITWAALLRPQWYEPKHYVTPVLKGGLEPSKALQGVTSAIVLTEDGMRLNAAQMFSWSQAIELTQAKIPAPADVWTDLADKAWSAPNPPSTSLWAMSFGNPQQFWGLLPPGGAVYNPFYTKEHVAQLFLNQTQHSDIASMVRMGDGIADIFPIDKDTALANYVPIQYLLDAPLGVHSMLSIYMHAVAPNVAFSLPRKWVDDVQSKISLVKSLDMLPQYSIFQNDTANNLLKQYAVSSDTARLQEFMQLAIDHQMLISEQTPARKGNAFDIGLPVSRYYVDAPSEAIMPSILALENQTPESNHP